MKAHLYVEGGGMVTGTHDVRAARKAIATEWLDQRGSWDDREDIAEASRLFRASEARLEVGRVVPESPANRGFSGYTWWWRTGYKLGKPGVTRAVVWNW